MRLKEIEELRRRVRVRVETLPSEPTTEVGVRNFDLRKRLSLKRRVMDAVAPTALRCLQPRFRRQLATRLDIPHDRVCLDDRWASGTMWAEHARRQPPSRIRSALVVGCWVGDGMVQHWLRAGVRRVHGIELLNLTRVWEETIPQLERAFHAGVEFRQASIAAIPYPDESFDLVSSAAVFEHVAHLEAAARETARVLTPGGYAVHGIGSMYCSYSGDHCISCYGPAAGYDHLLLPQPEYERKIHDLDFFASGPDPHVSFWARPDLFSFATPSEYFRAFAPYFDVAYSVAVVSREALRYRERYPERWAELRAAGLSETDLLVKSVFVVLRKKGPTGGLSGTPHRSTDG